MTATAIPIKAPDGSRTATRPGCAARDGVLPPEDGPALGAPRDGPAVRGAGSAGCEGCGDGLAGWPPPGALVPGRVVGSVPVCGVVACGPAG
jgi:hypothetical protein